MYVQYTHVLYYNAKIVYPPFTSTTPMNNNVYTCIYNIHKQSDPTIRIPIRVYPEMYTLQMKQN